MLAVLRGVAVLGPVGESGQGFALARDWVAAGGTRGGRATSAIDDTDRDRALAELARRYLAGHGPASAHDLAAWSGLPLRDARAALAAIAPELAERDDGLIELATLDPPPELPIPPRLLPSFDPYLLGWKDRSFAVAARHGRRVHPGGGMLRATATVDGKMVGTWTLPGGTVDLDLFARVDTAGRAALRVEADEIERFVR
jgi:hypothetical protein